MFIKTGPLGMAVVLAARARGVAKICVTGE